jgi:hypothetical protein
MRFKLNIKESTDVALLKCDPANLNFKMYVNDLLVVDTASVLTDIAAINALTTLHDGYQITQTVDNSDANKLIFTARVVGDTVDDNPRKVIKYRFVITRTLGNALKVFDKTWELNMYDTEFDVLIRRISVPNVFPQIGLQHRPWSNQIAYYVTTDTNNAEVYITKLSDGSAVAEGEVGYLPNTNDDYVLTINELLGNEQLEFDVTIGKRIVPQIQLDMTSSSTPDELIEFYVGVGIEFRCLFDLSAVLKIFNDTIEKRAINAVSIQYILRNLDDTLITSSPPVIVDLIDPTVPYDPNDSLFTYTPSLSLTNFKVRLKCMFRDWENQDVVIGYADRVAILSPSASFSYDSANCGTVTVTNTTLDVDTVTISKLLSDGTYEVVHNGLEFAAGESQQLTLADGVYKIQTKNYFYHRVIDCSITSCLYQSIIDLVQGEHCGCCDDCDDRIEILKYNFTSLQTMSQTYFGYLGVTNLTNIYTTPIDAELMASLTNIACLIEQMEVYCKECKICNDCN